VKAVGQAKVREKRGPETARWCLVHEDCVWVVENGGRRIWTDYIVRIDRCRGSGARIASEKVRGIRK
jgi:hypothetical protein